MSQYLFLFSKLFLRGIDVFLIFFSFICLLNVSDKQMWSLSAELSTGFLVVSPAALDYRLTEQGLAFEKRMKGMNSALAAGLDLCQPLSPLGWMMAKTLHGVP